MSNSLQTQKDVELAFRSQFLQNLLIKFVSFVIQQTGRISLTDCVYFPSYSVKYIPCFMLRHLMTS